MLYSQHLLLVLPLLALLGCLRAQLLLLRQGGSGFVPNDCDLGSERRLWLLTGPNMAGKSTFLRQNALIAVLAQAGSHVPAAAAHIGVVDRLYSRVGAADDLAEGRSTFMVEMVETAAILSQATERSFVILDEVGRGTSTYDGLALAWAVAEAVHTQIRCRCLFATHYHELARLAETCEALSLHHVRAREWQGDLVLLHELADGPADRSYGLAVARLAGVPAAVVDRIDPPEATEEENVDALPSAGYADDYSVPAGHHLTTGGNLTVNEAYIAANGVDADVILVGGDMVQIDVISQVNLAYTTAGAALAYPSGAGTLVARPTVSVDLTGEAQDGVETQGDGLSGVTGLPTSEAGSTETDSETGAETAALSGATRA